MAMSQQPLYRIYGDFINYNIEKESDVVQRRQKATQAFTDRQEIHELKAPLQSEISYVSYLGHRVK